MIYESWAAAEQLPDADIPVANPTLRSIFIRRGIADQETYRRFVTPSLADLHDAGGIHGIDHAAERIARAIRDNEAIVIYGDYDVDGVTSIVLLQTVLRSLGADVTFVVPQRLIDGNIISSRVPKDLPAFGRELVRLLDAAV